MKLFNREKRGQKLSGEQSSMGKKLPKDELLPTLERLIPIGQLSTQQLTKLPVSLKSYDPGEIIYNRGERVSSLDYLFSGEIYLETSGQQNITVVADTFHALYPLGASEYFNATAIARKKAVVLSMSVDVMEHFRQSRKYQAKNITVPDGLKNNNLLQRFVSSNELQIPALPDIAFKLRQAMDEDVGLNEIVKIIALDPSISAKLIQIANSPIYRGVAPITTCHNAIGRLGLNATRNIVTSISLNSLYRIKNKQLEKLARYYWNQSVKISALSHTLAKLTKTCDAEECMLAGLTSQIGIAPFLKYVSEQPEEQYSFDEVKAALPFVTSTLSSYVLEKWNFPEQMKYIPLQINRWFLLNNSKKPELSDIVLLARYHSLLGTQSSKKLPLITSLPSYSIIEDAELTPDKSLKILHDAHQQINEIMQVFSG